MYKTKKGLWRQAVTIDGKTKTFSAKNKKDLMMKIAQYRSEPHGIPLDKLADEWIEEVEERLSFNTMKGYRSAYKKIVNDWKDKPVDKITSQDVLSWLKRYDHLAQKTITNMLLVLRLIIDYGCVHYGLKYNPCDKVRPPKGTGKKSREFPSQEDIEIVNTHTDLPFGLFLYAILYTGMMWTSRISVSISDNLPIGLTITRDTIRTQSLKLEKETFPSSIHLRTSSNLSKGKVMN